MTTDKDNRRGTLIIIGGHEDREDERTILREVGRRVKGGKLVIATVATREPESYYDIYKKAFADLGPRELVQLHVHDRAEILEGKIDVLEDAAGVFFTGGDQLRISSQIGDTQIERRIREIYENGGVIAGTSAGASVMSDTMLVGGPSRESHHIGDLHMAAGLGLIRNVIIDQHFAERGRIGRLLGAVAQNPRILGIGIDENTAIVVENDGFAVLGAGAVYVADAGNVTYSNIAGAKPERALEIHDVRLHVLASGGRFDLFVRQPEKPFEKLS